MLPGKPDQDALVLLLYSWSTGAAGPEWFLCYVLPFPQAQASPETGVATQHSEKRTTFRRAKGYKQLEEMG